MTRHAWLCRPGLALVLVLALPAAAVAAGSAEPGAGAAAAPPATDPAVSTPGAAAAGAALFDRYCATCHGASGQGNGPTAAVISIAPADLTTLAAGNGGAFPLARVIRRIDGRDVVIAHGSPMPTYGAFFEGSRRVPVPTTEGEMAVALPVLDIVIYLQGVQRSPGADAP